jgi:hypothetical protein
MRKIPLTQGREALVDDADFEWLSESKWTAEPRKRRDGSIRTWYAQASRGGFVVRMHREIMIRRGLLVSGSRLEVDHIDRDGLNNQIVNLRVATRSQNNHNSSSRLGASLYKGVSRTGMRWRAQICGKHIGSFRTEREAALAYDVEARKKFGDYAYLNFPGEMVS